jgi:hypothetical protein
MKEDVMEEVMFMGRLRELYDNEVKRAEEEMRLCLINGAQDVYMTWLGYKNGLNTALRLVEKAY